MTKSKCSNSRKSASSSRPRYSRGKRMRKVPSGRAKWQTCNKSTPKLSSTCQMWISNTQNKSLKTKIWKNSSSTCKHNTVKWWTDLSRLRRKWQRIGRGRSVQSLHASQQALSENLQLRKIWLSVSRRSNAFKTLLLVACLWQMAPKKKSCLWSKEFRSFY